MKWDTVTRCSQCFILGKEMANGPLSICQGCVAARTPCTPPRTGNSQEYREQMLDLLRSAADDPSPTNMKRQHASLLVHVCVSRMNNSVDTDTLLSICDGPLLDIIKKLTLTLAELSMQFAESNLFPLLQLGELYHDNLFCRIIERVGLGFEEDIAEFTKLILSELQKPFGSPRGNTSAPSVSLSADSSKGCPPKSVEQVALLAAGVEVMDQVMDQDYDQELDGINSPITSPSRGLEELLKDFPASDDASKWVSLINSSSAEYHAESRMHPSQNFPYEPEEVETWYAYLRQCETNVSKVVRARQDTRLVESEMEAKGVYITDDDFLGSTDGHFESTLREFATNAVRYTDFADGCIVEGH